MLNPEPITALTPFENGRTYLPTRNDVERICSLTSNAYATARVGRRQKVKREWAVEKTIRETVRTIRRVNTPLGQIRLRAKLGEDPTIDLFGEAVSLNVMYPH